MVRLIRIQKRRYFDSMFLMYVTKQLQAQPGIKEAAVVMGTPANVQILLGLGFPASELDKVEADDLVIAVEAENHIAAQAALGKVEEFLSGRKETTLEAPKTLTQALALLPEANLAVISLPGRYAGKEALRALDLGLNVFLFSSNVPLAEEITMKQKAKEKGLLVMGPDCGTALIAGVGLGFANVVRRGPIGLIAASGTGAQEFISLVHRAGAGISHVIGTGSRDLSAEVQGLTTLSALDALEEDSLTEVIVLLGKPPSESTLLRLAERLKKVKKPVIACFLGTLSEKIKRSWPGQLVSVIDDAVAAALSALGYTIPEFLRPPRLERLVEENRQKLSTKQRYVRGIFSGGTFCYQAQLLFHAAGIPFKSNTPLSPEHALINPFQSEGHTLLDMGDEFFTEGRLHPMIDPTLRRERILQEAKDPEVAVLLLDFVLGHNASPDPVGDLISAIVQAKTLKEKQGEHLIVVGSVCGTEEDPQNYVEQVQKLVDAGVLVFPTQAQAVRFIIALLGGAI